MSIQLIMLLVLVALASAQVRPLCSMPQVWEARRIEFDPNERVYHNHTSDFRSFARYAYDGTFQRKRIYEEVRFGTTPDQRFDILELHSVKLLYVTNIGT